MKLIHKTLFVCGVATAIIFTGNLSAQKSAGTVARVIAKYDSNQNGAIDGDEEKASIRKDYKADRKGELRRFDLNKDGKLSDDEIAKITPGSSGKKGGKKDGKKDGEKSNDKESTSSTKSDPVKSNEVSKE